MIGVSDEFMRQASPNHYIEDLRAERDALRAVVARVEGLAAELDGDGERAYQRSCGHRDEGSDGQYRAYEDAADRIREALGSTDSDPAATERQGEAEGAGDGV